MVSLRTATKSVLVAAALMVLLTSCGPFDSQVPWETTRMMGELTSDLRRFEGLTSDFEHYEVLAWQVNARDDRDRVEIVLVWGRTPTHRERARWALVQGFRHPDGDNRWQRSLFNRYLRSPLTHTRPGEDWDGTWHAFQMYEHATTALEICEFAIVDFFGPVVERAGYRRLSGSVQKRAWLRVTGEEPPCGFAT
jgi:hypothetical protein